MDCLLSHEVILIGHFWLPQHMFVNRRARPGTCSALGTDWAGHAQDGLTHSLGLPLSFKVGLSSLYSYHTISVLVVLPCVSICGNSRLLVLFHVLRRRSVSFNLISREGGKQPFPMLSASPGLCSEHLPGAWGWGSWILRVKRRPETPAIGCPRDSRVTFVPPLQEHLQLKENLPLVQKPELGNELLISFNTSSDSGSFFPDDPPAGVVCPGLECS